MPNPIATFDTTMGKIKCEIFLDQMPITASNFIDLANSGFYNGLHCERRAHARKHTPYKRRPPPLLSPL